MKYYFFALIDDVETAHVGDVALPDQAYLQANVVPHLMAISADDYVNSLVVIMQTAARFSYVLTDNALYWCIEWDPGFIIVKFSTQPHVEWAALRSPIPNFGGRASLAEDELSYDEDADNPQYNLIFTPWDAQFDAQDRTWLKACQAIDEQKQQFASYLKYVDSLDVPAPDEKEAYRQWFHDCKIRIGDMAGEGLRV